MNTLWRPFFISVSVKNFWQASNSSRSWSLSSSFSKIFIQIINKITRFPRFQHVIFLAILLKWITAGKFSLTRYKFSDFRVNFTCFLLVWKFFLLVVCTIITFWTRNNSFTTYLSMSSRIGSTVLFTTVLVFHLPVENWHLKKMGDFCNLACSKSKKKFMAPTKWGESFKNSQKNGLFVFTLNCSMFIEKKLKVVIQNTERLF